METLLSESGPILAMMGCAFVAILGSIGPSLGVGAASVIGAGVATERPDAFFRIFILSALPCSQSIYCFIGVILVLMFFNVSLLTFTQGWEIFFACMPLAFSSFFSAIFKGKVVVAGMNIIAKNPSNVGKAIILASIIEIFAIFGLLSSILMLNDIRLSIAATA